MPDDPYSISDLSRLADVTPRTIRYYVSQGLLPSPEVAGPATRYGKGHLQRLRLIRRLQRDHLPLAEIRARLEQLGDDEVRTMMESDPAAVPAPMPADTLAYVRDLMAQTGVRPRAAESPALYLRSASRYEPSAPEGFPQQPPATMPPTLPAPSLRPGVADRTTWERHVLAPDVELHVRRPLDRRMNKRVEQLIRIAKELFDEES
jgi:DNA-binding transcriptional MerR regulator